MKKEKAYYYDYENYSNRLEELYLNNNSIYTCLTKNNLDKLMNTLLDTLKNTKIKTITKKEPHKEKITCISIRATKSFEELFENEDLVIFGHGGAAKKIIESGEFKCRYNNLSSHFIPLEQTNESLSMLNNWPHMGHTEIAILALNKREYNPIYKEREQLNSYDTDIYSISTEYFAGYYDVKEKKFIPNPSFKTKHQYNPKNTDYDNEESFNPVIIDTKDKNICEFINLLRRIQLVLIFASFRNLSIFGIINVKQQLIHYMKKTYELQKLFTREYIEKVIETEEKEQKREEMNSDFNEDWLYWGNKIKK